jgi:transposase
MLAHLRAARYGHLLACHILLLCAAGRTPPEIACALLWARSRVYRTVRADRRGALALGLGEATVADAPVGRASLKRSVRALLKRAPQVFGWCRTRWSGAARSAELQARRRVPVSQETVRRWLPEMGDVWKRARQVARHDDPERVSQRARMRSLLEHVLPTEALVFAAQWDLHLRAQLGGEWMLKGTHSEVMTPGTHRKHELAGALNCVTGKVRHLVGERKTRWLFIELLRFIDRASPAVRDTKS